MKKLLLSILFVWCFVSFGNAQFAEKGFSFQGYARDFEGAALGNQTISAKFSIYPQGKAMEYEEAQSLRTDPYGVFHAVIGSVKPVEFAKVNWSSANYWLKVEIKANGGDYVEISNTSLLSVPYANAAFNGVPSGSIIPFAGPKNRIPAGYVACDGTEYSATVYPGLFAALGNTWGGNGTSTFRVPDLRGQFLRGQNDGSGVDPDAGNRFAKNGGKSGDNVGSFQDDENKRHNHGVTDPGHTHGYDDKYNRHERSDNANDRDVASNGTTSDWRTTGSSTTNISINSAGGNESRPKNAAVYYIIKL